MKQLFSSIWLQYKMRIEEVVFEGAEQGEKDIFYWKNKVFCNILVYIVPASTLALVPGVYMSYKNGIPMLGIADLLAFGTMIFIALVPGIRIKVRKAVFFICLYTLSVLLFYYLGSFGPGMMFLLALNVLSCVVLPSRSAYFSILINAGICILIAIFIAFQPAGSKLTEIYSLGTWIAESSNVILLSVVCTTCLIFILKGFDNSLHKVTSTEERVVISEKNLSSFFNTVNEMLFSTDTVLHRMIQVSPACEKIYGYLQAEFMADPELWLKLIHPDDQPMMADIDNQLSKNKEVIHQFRIIRKDGILRWVEHKLTPTYSNSGQLIRVDGVVTDITERKEAEEAIIKSEKRFRSLVENANEIIALLNARGEILYMSSSVKNILGYLPDDRMGQSGLKYGLESVHPDDLPGMQQCLAEIMANPGAVITSQWRQKHANGSWRWMEGLATNLLHDPSVNAVVHNFRDITIQKEAEEKLKAERNLLRTLIDNMPDAVYIKDRLGRKIVSNTVDFKIIGAISESAVLGKTAQELFPGKRGVNAYLDDMEVIKTGKPIFNKELEIIDETGRANWVLNTKIPLKDENGEVIGLVGISKDLTSRKQMEIELQKSNERFEYVSQASFDAIWDWDLLTDQVYKGKGFETLFGLNINEMKPDSSSWSDLIHPDDRDTVLEGIHELINSHSNSWSEEYRFCKSDGSYAYVRDRGVLVRDENGKATRMIGAMQDITQKKIEEDQLHLLESVITHAKDAVIITEAEPIDAPGPRIIYVNDTVTKLTGYSKDELIGANPRIFQGPDTSREQLDLLRNALTKWEPCEVELKNYRKNGELFWNNVSVVPLANEAGWFTHWIAIERDVTEKKMVEEEIKEKNNELKKLSSYLQNVREEERKYIAREVHDELGQLASALKIDVDWLGLKIGSLDEAGKNRIAHANKTIEVLISSIRKIASRLRPSVLDDFGLNAALQWYCAEFQNLNGIPCTFEPGFDDSHISQDMKTEFFRMTQESLTNIMRHAKATQVVVTTREDAEKRYLTVTDNGNGFDISKRKSTLGLVGLRERAVSLNGELHIHSEIGKGTIISAIIPK